MTADDGMSITVKANGPYLVTGGVPLARQTIVSDEQGFSVEWRGTGATRLSSSEVARLAIVPPLTQIKV